MFELYIVLEYTVDSINYEQVYQIMTETQCPENQLTRMQMKLLLFPKKSSILMSLFKEA